MPLLKRLGRVTQLNGVADLLINDDGGDRTYQLQQGDSGKVFYVEQDDNVISIYLPMAVDAGAGWHINIIVRAIHADEGVFVYNHGNDDDNIHGIAFSFNSNYGEVSDGTAKNSIGFRADDTVIGDRIEIFCDGTVFYCYGWSVDDGAIYFGS